MSNPLGQQKSQLNTPSPLAGGQGPKYPTGPKKTLLRKVQKQGRKFFDSGDYAMSKAGKSVDTVGEKHPSPENIPHQVLGKSPASSPVARPDILNRTTHTSAPSAMGGAPPSLRQNLLAKKAMPGVTSTSQGHLPQSSGLKSQLGEQKPDSSPKSSPSADK
ncbi:hypothetical protein H4219_000778 [Mycoemilia scoparia]|uniref:mRNA stability protein n=1 Tax=Mycoemilia scoparia TaxID=417184 RepID=A0A9W8DR41_9FUNG|nr:hypothetical protein H4219_000778 [Mycoemilia scoparia]